ncbi:uncharacterized protein V6R79_002750 [Siganus canaliculatus]
MLPYNFGEDTADDLERMSGHVRSTSGGVQPCGRHLAGNETGTLKSCSITDCANQIVTLHHRLRCLEKAAAVFTDSAGSLSSWGQRRSTRGQPLVICYTATSSPSKHRALYQKKRHLVRDSQRVVDAAYQPPSDSFTCNLHFCVDIKDLSHYREHEVITSRRNKSQQYAEEEEEEEEEV